MAVNSQPDHDTIGCGTR